MPCGAIFPVHQNLVVKCDISCVCCMHPLVVAKPLLPSIQLSTMTLFVCCGQGLVAVLLVDESGVFFHLS